MSDLGVECGGEQHTLTQWVAGALLVFYACIVPLGILVITVFNRHRLQEVEYKCMYRRATT